MIKFMFIFAIAGVLFSSCLSKPQEESPIPQNENEWTVRLSSPVSAFKQEVFVPTLPPQVLEVFKKEMIIFPGNISFEKIKVKDDLLSNDFISPIVSSLMLTWNKGFEKPWDGENDPTEYVYLIKYKHQYPENGLVVIWFTDRQTIMCSKVDYKELRPKMVFLPKFKKPVVWKWQSYNDNHYDNDYVKGDNSRPFVKDGVMYTQTTWEGGGLYALPPFGVEITADDKIIYSD